VRPHPSGSPRLAWTNGRRGLLSRLQKAIRDGSIRAGTISDRSDDLGPLGLVLFLRDQVSVPKFLEPRQPVSGFAAGLGDLMRKLMLAVAPVVVLTAVGCGGSGGSTSASARCAAERTWFTHTAVPLLHRFQADAGAARWTDLAADSSAAMASPPPYGGADWTAMFKDVQQIVQEAQTGHIAKAMANEQSTKTTENHLKATLRKLHCAGIYGIGGSS
jgi:hypothetical protein